VSQEESEHNEVDGMKKGVANESGAMTQPWALQNHLME